MTPSKIEIYAQAPVDQVEALQQFRERHPYRKLRVGEVEWPYIASGAGDETLVVLGGALSTGESSFRTIQRLEPHLRVLAPSYPAVGSMEAACRGLEAILEHEKVGRAHLYGHSMGAAVAHVFTRQRPERVGKLALSGFGLYDSAGARQVRLSSTVFGWLPYWLIRGLYAQRIRQLLAGVEPEEGAFMTAYYRDLLEVQHDRSSFLGQFRILADLASHPQQYQVSEPVEKPGEVLILQAADDRGFQPNEQAALRETYPGAQVKLFESGGHWAMLTRREEYERVLDEFLGVGTG